VEAMRYPKTDTIIKYTPNKKNGGTAFYEGYLKNLEEQLKPLKIRTARDIEEIIAGSLEK
jgi:hypothetical protein